MNENPGEASWPTDACDLLFVDIVMIFTPCPFSWLAIVDGSVNKDELNNFLRQKIEYKPIGTRIKHYHIGSILSCVCIFKNRTCRE